MERMRPLMKDYGIANDRDGLLDWTWVEEQITQSKNYWVCTTRADGRPHAAPVWGVYRDGAVYFSTGPSVKQRNLFARPDVVIHLESGDDCVILEGRIEVMSDAELYAQIRRQYGDKYPHTPPEDFENAGYWFKLQPAVVLAWKEYDFPRSATRWEFQADADGVNMR